MCVWSWSWLSKRENAGSLDIDLQARRLHVILHFLCRHTISIFLEISALGRALREEGGKKWKITIDTNWKDRNAKGRKKEKKGENKKIS